MPVGGTVAMAEQWWDSAGSWFDYYFDEESEDAWKITKGQVYLACIAMAGQSTWSIKALLGFSTYSERIGWIRTTSPFSLAILLATSEHF